MNTTINVAKYVILPCLCLFLMVSCEQPTLVTIEDTNYTMDDFMENYQFEPTDDSTVLYAKVNEYVDQLLMMHEARNQDYEDDPIVKEAFETHRRDIISRSYYEKMVIDKAKVSEADIRQRYDELIDTYHLAQIVCEEESIGIEVKEMLDKGVAFESLLVYSLDTLTENGDIGNFSASQLPPVFLDPIKQLRDGQCSEPILFGEYYYIIKLIEHTTADEPAYSDVEESIRMELKRQLVLERAEEFIDGIIQDAQIEYNDEGLAALIKPDSLLTEKDLALWVVKKYDSSYVYVRTLRSAVYYQYMQSQIEPKRLIDRVLIPDLVYERAVQEHFDQSAIVKERLDKALDLLMYQKYYSDNVLEFVKVDSAGVIAYYKKHQDEFPNRTLDEVFTVIMARLRDSQIVELRNEVAAKLRDKYNPVLNEKALEKTMKEER